MGPGLLLLAAAFFVVSPAAAQEEHAGHEAGSPDSAAAGPAAVWRMPPMPATMPMLPPLMGKTPPVRPFLPGEGIDPAELPEAGPGKVRSLSDGDTLRLEAVKVRREIRGRTFVMYAFNAQHPGPLIRVSEGATIVVEFRNSIDLPSTVHWHGVRLDNRFDGVPKVTQEPVPPGGTFTYRVHLPDPGIYWYHPHVRSDVQQDLGLYGNLDVRPTEEGYYNPVNAEEVVVLDDLLVDGRGIFPYGREHATHTLMGRFGNLFLVNGELDYRLTVGKGAVVRFFLTNVSNTRTFNLVFGGNPTKVVGADVGKFEREERIDNLVIGPAQRYIVEVLFPEAGEYVLTNRVQAIDHFNAEYYAQVDTLGTLRVREEPAEAEHAEEFRSLRENEDAAAEIAEYRDRFDDPVDRRLELLTRPGNLPRSIVDVMAMDTLYVPPMEWNDVMPTMNYLSSGRQMEWVIRDVDTGRENMDVHWTFDQGEVVKIQIRNRADAFHPMQHPMHLHGQRFLVLSRNGEPTENLVWKDTAIVPAGATVELLVEMSNPGDWLFHCHVSEHVESGMQVLFTVKDVPGVEGPSSDTFSGGAGHDHTPSGSTP